MKIKSINPERNSPELYRRHGMKATLGDTFSKWKGSREAFYGEFDLPALVVHGDDDPMLPLAAGKATADTIPNAELLIIHGMGHAMPYPDNYWGQIVDAMMNHIRSIR